MIHGIEKVADVNTAEIKLTTSARCNLIVEKMLRTKNRRKKK